MLTTVLALVKTPPRYPLYGTYPCRVLLQVAAQVLDGVGVAKLLQELHLFDDVLPFLHSNRKTLSSSF